MSMKNIYKKIAKEHGVTWQEVRNDMQSALNHAYTDQNRNILNIVRQKEVEKTGEIPTPEEFIAHATKILNSDKKQS